MKDQAEVADRLDLRGEVCPYTFVKTTLALEEMAAGQVLEVTVDHAPAVENVPRSAANRGHEVVGVRQSGANWVITLRKGEEE